MKWVTLQGCPVKIGYGLQVPIGTIWNIDTESISSSHISIRCQALRIQTNLSFVEYVEMFGEDNHIWKIDQKVNSWDTKFRDTLQTILGDKWTIVDLGDGVSGTSVTEISIKIGKRIIKEMKRVQHAFSYSDYIEFFGEDDHVSKKMILEKRFDL